MHLLRSTVWKIQGSTSILAGAHYFSPAKNCTGWCLNKQIPDDPSKIKETEYFLDKRQFSSIWKILKQTKFQIPFCEGSKIVIWKKKKYILPNRRNSRRFRYPKDWSWEKGPKTCRNQLVDDAAIRRWAFRLGRCLRRIYNNFVGNGTVIVKMLWELELEREVWKRGGAVGFLRLSRHCRALEHNSNRPSRRITPLTQSDDTKVCLRVLHSESKWNESEEVRRGWIFGSPP